MRQIDLNNILMYVCENLIYVYSRPITLSPEFLSKENLSNADLVEHMCNTQVGAGFVNRHMGLPQNTFVSNDAVTWLINNTEMFNTREEAVKRLQVLFKLTILSIC